MSDIAPLGFSHSNGPGSTAASGSSAVSSVNGTGSAKGIGASSNGSVRQRDKVEISQAAQLLSKLHNLPDVRQDLVDRVRGQIAQGTYETPAKINAAIDALEYDL